MPRKVRQLNVKFPAEERRRLKRAADLASKRARRRITSADIIREATRRYVDAVIAGDGKEPPAPGAVVPAYGDGAS